jgi:hypothetical protein
MNRSLRLALALAITLHWPLVATRCYRLSYDAYVHMFFADHYRSAWWTLWEPRWYTGFSVASYPPLVHQIIALLSHIIGIENAWAIVLLSVLILLPVGVYAFAQQFVGRLAAGYAALTAATLPSIFLTAHTFGQLPTLAGLLGALWCLAALGNYLRAGRLNSWALAVSLVAVVTASHHGTLLFLPWGIMAVGVHTALIRRVALRPLLYRLCLFGVGAGATALVVIWPFWRWGLAQTMQTPIDHASRHNFFQDSWATVLFFWPMYGPLILIIPWVLRLAYRRKRFAIGTLFIVMFILGLGGTTPLPSWLYGRRWEWLTCDRFALWASISLSPLVGEWATLVKHIVRQRLPISWPATGSMALLVIGCIALIAAQLPTLLPTQPTPVDMRPIVAFLAEDGRSQWRYLTFGFGDQMARLSLLTDATTIDGSYHTARELPELRASGLGQIDTAYWLPYGMDALHPVLERASARGVRWGFVNLRAYDRVLEYHGWVRLTALTNGIDVWENPSAIRPVPDDPASHSDPIAASSWGIFPPASLVIAIGLYITEIRGTRARRGSPWKGQKPSKCCPTWRRPT